MACWPRTHVRKPKLNRSREKRITDEIVVDAYNEKRCSC